MIGEKNNLNENFYLTIRLKLKSGPNRSRFWPDSKTGLGF